MAIGATGREYDLSFKLLASSGLNTTTSQYACVGLIANTTTAAERSVQICGATYSADATNAAFYCIGVNQSYLSASSGECTVRMFGVSKVICAQSVSVGDMVMPYWGISTTTMPGRVVVVDNAVTTTVFGQTVTSHCVILGRALESGSTGTVISVFVNPQLYEFSLVGSISIT